MFPSMRKALGATVVLAAAVLAACGAGDAPVSAPQPLSGPQAPAAPTSLQGLQGSAAAAGRLGQASSNGGYTIDTTNRAQVLLFYRTVYASSTQTASGWTGNIEACNAGDVSAEYRAAQVRRINWFRAMAGVPASVQFDSTFNAKAQQAALMMAAQQQLSHSPGTDWKCYSANGAEGAGKSNLTIGRNGPSSVGESYIRDTGTSNYAVGHRRWVFYPQTQLMGSGDVDGAVKTNALWVQDANYFSARPTVRDDFVAWPPKGYTPYTVVYPRWSISYPQADFSAAVVTMTENGVPMATRKETLLNGYGENTLVWIPGSYTDGATWAKPAQDTVYQVTVSNVTVGGVARSFSYTTTVFDPDATASEPISIAGSASLAPGQAGAYSFSAVTGATGYEWRTLATTPYTLVDGAESGTGNFTVATTGSYPVVTSDAAASGGSSFHLAHPSLVEQVLTLNQALAVDASSSLQFASRLGLSSPAQWALVEVSADDGGSWKAIYEQAGQQTGSTSSFGETSFSTRTISLAAYAGRVIRLRWRYAPVMFSLYFNQSSQGVGWYIDDIRLDNVSAVSAQAGTAIASTSFQVTGGANNFALQARAGMYGYYSDWGLLKTVTAGAAQATGTECLLNWAQTQYPSLFSPAASTQTLAPYAFRYYTATGVYLGISTDGNVYYMLPGGQPVNAGAKTGWFVTAGCSP